MKTFSARCHSFINIVIMLLLMTGSTVCFASAEAAEAGANGASADAEAATRGEIAVETSGKKADETTETLAESTLEGSVMKSEEVIAAEAAAEKQTEAKRDEQAEAEQKEQPEAERDEQAETKQKELVEVVVAGPVLVNVTDYGAQNSYLAGDDGTVRISDIFVSFDAGADASESFVLVVNGKSYPVTRYSDGRTVGKLPAGFSIDKSSLIIKGLDSDLDISIVDHAAMSALYEGPAYEESGKSSANKKTARRARSQYSDSAYAANAYVSFAEGNQDAAVDSLSSDRDGAEDTVRTATYTATDELSEDTRVLGEYEGTEGSDSAENANGISIPIAALISVCCIAAGLIALLGSSLRKSSK